MASIPFDDLLDEKACRKCGEVKPLSRFHHASGCADGHTHRCKDCKLEEQRAWRAANPELQKQYSRKSLLRGKFGMELDDYAQVLEAQGGVCAICRKPCISGRRLAVDHDHRCCPGKIACGKCNRGLLCAQCNRGLGCFSDDKALLGRAMEYLS